MINKIPLELPICTSTDILRTLPKLKGNLEKFEKDLLSTFYLLIKNFRGKHISEEENKNLLIENPKNELQFLLGSKKL